MHKPNPEWYIKKILDLRNTLRQIRDAKGDDRCWVDDYLIWKFNPMPPNLPRLTFEENMKRCELFYEFRRSEKVFRNPADAILDPLLWDSDLTDKCRYQLDEIYGDLLEGTLTHYLTSLDRPLTVDDDRLLYSRLPEKLEADFRLPPRGEFLGTEKIGAGCPNFWKSHTNCGQNCNIHQWGPCK